MKVAQQQSAGTKHKKCLDACAGRAGSVGLAEHGSDCAQCWAQVEYSSVRCSQQISPSDTCSNRSLLDCAQVINILCGIYRCTDSWRYDGVCGGCWNSVFFTHPLEKLAKDASSLSLIQPFSALHVRAQVAAVGVLHHKVNPLGALGLDKQYSDRKITHCYFSSTKATTFTSCRRAVLEGFTKGHLPKGFNST